jgi:hypothetical protein
MSEKMPTAQNGEWRRKVGIAAASILGGAAMFGVGVAVGSSMDASPATSPSASADAEGVCFTKPHGSPEYTDPVYKKGTPDNLLRGITVDTSKLAAEGASLELDYISGSTTDRAIIPPSQLDKGIALSVKAGSVHFFGRAIYAATSQKCDKEADIDFSPTIGEPGSFQAAVDSGALKPDF